LIFGERFVPSSEGFQLEKGYAVMTGQISLLAIHVFPYPLPKSLSKSIVRRFE
jgi:hypothetical protein